MKKLSIMMACAIFAGTLLAEIGITPPTGHFDRSGGPGTITTTGSGTWTANSPDRWISVKTVSGTAGYAVAYTVEENSGVEMRTGHVYVSGNTHTVVQSGVGASLDKYSAEFENGGGSGYVTVSAEPGSGWTAKSNVSWIQVYTASGTGQQTIRYSVSRYDEVSTRSGTLTIADNIFTVTQTGLRMKLASNSASLDYLQATVKVRVNALAETMWSVEEDAGWLSVADAGPGEGGGIVVLAVEENASYSERNATVRIGTEVFSVRQLGRTDLVFKISTNEFSAAAAGTSGERIAVTATPDLGWSAASDSDWIQLYPDYKSGSGNGSVAYKVTSNTSLYPRTGTITITAVDKHVAAKRVDVSQEAAVATLTRDSYEFAAGGGSVNIGVSTEAGVGWTVSNPNSWITISDIPVAGPATLKLTAQAHTSVSPRSGTITIAGHEFAVSQSGRGVTLDCVAKAFDTDGKPQGKDAENVIQVTTSPNVEWEAVASDATWIVIYEGKTGKGNGTVKYVVAPYIGAGEPREGAITVGDQTVHITQRPYELSIDPMGEWVTGNSGAGEIQVSLDIAGVWDAIATASWIIIDKITRDPETGNGKVLFHYTDNNTGEVRPGSIIISGVEYTLTQQARQNVAISVEAEGHGGLVSGGGTYNIGDRVVLAAVVQDGYAFDGWTLPGGGTSMETTIEVVASAAQTYKAKFVPLAPTLRIASERLLGVLLEWVNVPWAANYCVWRGVSASRAAAAKIATLTNDGTCRYFDGSGAENQRYWYWVEAVGAEDDTWSGGMQGMRARKAFAVSYLNLRGASHENPQSYTEGAAVRFSPPGDIPGYTFEGWSPEGITAETTGDISVTAIWRQNEYFVKFDPNRGTGEMQDERFMYGFWRNLSPLAFSCDDCAFLGWSTVRDGEAVYADEQPVKSLSAVDGDVVSLYASWKGVPKCLSVVGECTEFYASESRSFSAVLRYSNGIEREIMPTWSISSGTAYASVDGARGLVTGVPYDNAAHVVTLKASYSEDGVTVTAERALTIKPCVSVSDAAGNGTISFSQDGDAAWVGQMDVSHDGTASLRTGVLDAGERCGLGSSVTGPGTLSFWWRTSGNGLFSFEIDGEERAQTMSNGWLNVSVELLTNKVYDLSWQYVQGTDSDKENDFGWLDEVEWVPAPERVNIFFDTAGGVGIPDREYATGAPWGNLPVAVRDGYAFEGWTEKRMDLDTPVVVIESDYVPLHDSWLYANWKANDYEISFVPAGGTGYMPNIAATYDVALAIPACTFTRIGCTFAGWSLYAGDTVIAFEDGAVVSNLTSVAGNTAMLYAVWETNSYTVTFNANGGTGGKTVTQDFGTALAAPTVTRTGYTFAGWSPAVPATVPAGDATYVAQWTKNKYTVTFNANGGAGGWSKSMDYGAAIAAPTVTRTGYTFTGWSPTVAGTVPADNVTYTAQWKVNQYTVTFNANGGTGGKTVTQDFGTALAAPTVTRTGYTFAGWSPAVPATVPAGDATYVAQWTKNKYTVTFDANGGTGEMENAALTYDTPQNLPNVGFRRMGYTFAGWSLSLGGDVAFDNRATVSNLTAMANGSVVLYAVWVANSYVIEYNPGEGGGGTMPAQPMTYDSAATLSGNGFSRKGYSFAGWTDVPGGSGEVKYSDGASVSNLVDGVNGRFSLYAVWEANSYTVSFDANGGTGEMENVELTYDTPQNLPNVGFRRMGYTFAGWSLSLVGDVAFANHATVSNLTAMANGSVVLYAVWVANSYVIEYNPGEGGGGTMPAQPMTYDSAATLSGNGFSRKGYSFAGWTDVPGGSGEVKYSDGASVSNLVDGVNGRFSLYAVWEANSYTVSFDANGGSGTMAGQPMVYDVAVTLSPNGFARSDAWFMGWSTAPGGKQVYVDGESVSNLTSVADGVVTLYAVWKMKPEAVLVCEGTFGEVGMVTLDENGDIVVTLTNDVSGTVEIPDNVGVVIINLNGHDMVGDGPAIRIVAGDGDGAGVMQLAFVDMSDGKKGHVVGGGESAGIEIADGAAYGVSLDVDDAVSVLNGDGSEQDCSLLGRGALPWPTDGAYNPLVANVYDGYILDGDGALAGIIQVKAVKQAVKSVTDKVTKVKTATTNVAVTATVTDTAGKKWSYSKGAGTVDGVVTGLVCTTKGVPVPSFGVTLGANGLEGEWGGFLVAGARNGMGTKGDAMMAALDANYKKSWTVALTNEMGATHIQLVVGAKGSVKISGVTPDGFKISATVNGVMGDDAFFVPYLATLKSGKLTRPANLLLTLGEDGTVYVRTSDFGSLKAGGLTTDAIAVQPYAESATSKGGEPYAGAVVLNDLAYPAKFAAKGLPAGLNIDAASGAITGTPTKSGHYTATITVTSGINSKKKVETKVEFVIGNYTDTAIGVEDSYSGYCVGVMASESIAAALGCSVSGLPAGLKFAAKETKDKTFGTVPAGTVYGIPTKAGEYTVYFKKSEKVNGKSVNHQASATFNVEALPDWAQGTFSGGLIEAALSGGGHAGSVTLPAGLMSLTVDSKGKISGKLIDSAGTWTLSAASYSNVERPSSDVDDSVFHVTVIGKNGKLMATNEVAVALDDAARSASAPYRRGVVSCGEWTAWQNLWKTDPWKNDDKAYAKAPKLTVGEIELKFGASGTVTAKYGKYSCSTTLIPVEDGTFYVLCYFAPKGEAAYGAEIFLKWDAAEKKFSAVDQ